jgi:hypothetical protein
MIVDRIEDGVATLEDDLGWLDVPDGWLPAGATEGSVLRVEVERDGDSSRVTLTLDAAAQAEREAEMRRLRESIPEGPEGDLEL